MGGIVSWLWRDPTVNTGHTVSVSGSTSHTVTTSHTISAQVSGSTTHTLSVNAVPTIQAAQNFFEKALEWTFNVTFAALAIIFGLLLVARLGIWLFWPPASLYDFLIPMRLPSCLFLAFWLAFKSGLLNMTWQGSLSVARLPLTLFWFLSILCLSLDGVSICLFYKHQLMSIMFRLVLASSVVAGGCFWIIYPRRADIIPQQFDITILDIKNRRFTVRVDLSEVIESVKQKIQDRGGLEPSCQVLVCGDQKLEDSNCISDYNILPGTVLKCFIRKRGGCGLDWCRTVSVYEGANLVGSHAPSITPIRVGSNATLHIALSEYGEVCMPDDILDGTGEYLTLMAHRSRRSIACNQSYLAPSHTVILTPVDGFISGGSYNLRPTSRLLPDDNGAGLRIDS